MKMTKRIITAVAVAGIVLFSGCSSKPRMISTGTVHNQAPVVIVKVANGAGAPSYGYNESKAFRNVLEASAEGTLKRGYKYFAIVAPKAISNINGSLKNTAKELIEKCSSSSAFALSMSGGNMRECGVRNTQANIKIALFNKEQHDFTVIDAQGVVDYLKANDLYDGNGIEEVNK